MDVQRRNVDTGKLSRYSFKFGDIIGIPTDYTNDVQFIELSQLADIGIIKSESMMHGK